MRPLTTRHPIPRIVSVLALIAIAAGLAACADPAAVTPTRIPRKTSTPSPTDTPAPLFTPTWTPIPSGEGTLRAAAAVRGVYIGAAVDWPYISAEPKYMTTLGREFNMLTPETEMKFDLAEPHQGQFDFERADKLVDFAGANRMAVRGHVLVWHQAIPRWFAEGEFSREESMAILHDWITAIVSRYRGRVTYWDVVNEAWIEDGAYRKSIWMERIGPEYVALAFQWAHEADPNAILFYNDYGIDDLNSKSSAIYLKIKDLKEKGVPIGGVGLQMHIRADTPPRAASVKANMERFAALGLAVHITEMDVSTTYQSGPADFRQKQQADAYRDIAGACLEVRACGALVIWGIGDRHTWLRHFTDSHETPLLFDDYYRPKPAYEALLYAFQTFQ